MINQSVNLICFSSTLNNLSNTIDNRESLNILRSSYKLNYIQASQLKESIDSSALTAIFIESGGSEELFVKSEKYLPKSLIIISDYYNNSLAATLEICSWLKSKNRHFFHLHIPLEVSEKKVFQIKEQIGDLFSIQQTLSWLDGSNIALFGNESPWLISSHIDKKYITEKYGVNFIDFSTTYLIERFNQTDTNDSHCREVIDKLSSKLEDNRSLEDLELAVKLYKSIYNICLENKIRALTIKCFDILDISKTTACLALSLLNDSDIICGCEGDIPSLWSMIIAKQLCNSNSFMANPSSIETLDKSIDFSHCTIPLSISESYKLTSHYESKIGIGIKSLLKLGKYTIFKCAGEKLNKAIIFEGNIIQNTDVINRCRTQIKFSFNSIEEQTNFLNSYMGNHTIIVPCECSRKLKIWEEFIKTN